MMTPKKDSVAQHEAIVGRSWNSNDSNTNGQSAVLREGQDEPHLARSVQLLLLASYRVLSRDTGPQPRQVREQRQAQTQAIEAGGPNHKETDI